MKLITKEMKHLIETHRGMPKVFNLNVTDSVVQERYILKIKEFLGDVTVIHSRLDTKVNMIEDDMRTFTSHINRLSEVIKGTEGTVLVYTERLEMLTRYREDRRYLDYFRKLIERHPDTYFVTFAEDVALDKFVIPTNAEFGQAIVRLEVDEVQVHVIRMFHNLTRIRGYREIQQRELSKETGIQQGSISRIEGLENVPSTETFIRIARGIGLSYEEIGRVVSGEVDEIIDEFR